MKTKRNLTQSSKHFVTVKGLTFPNAMHAQHCTTDFTNRKVRATELDIRLLGLIDECQFPKPDVITGFLKWNIFINAINYYEVKKWASQQPEMELLHIPKL